MADNDEFVLGVKSKVLRNTHNRLAAGIAFQSARILCPPAVKRGISSFPHVRLRGFRRGCPPVPADACRCMGGMYA